jgi:hypothetical protein
MSKAERAKQAIRIGFSAMRAFPLARPSRAGDQYLATKIRQQDNTLQVGYRQTTATLTKVPLLGAAAAPVSPYHPKLEPH